MPDTGPISDVIFDLDGTLVDSAPSILLCLAEALASQGIAPMLPLSPLVVGLPLRETLRNISGCDDDKTIAAMADTFVEHYDLGGYGQTQGFAGVEPMLRGLEAAGMRLHIATNKRLRPTQLILSHLGWSKLFCTVYAPDLRKPSFLNKSEMLGALLKAEGITPTAAIYIGDRGDDRKAARANALPFIAAVWGYRDDDLLASSEDLIVAENPGDIPHAIERHIPGLARPGDTLGRKSGTLKSFSMSGTRPLFSVCIPTYNRASYLEATLTSLIEQPAFQASDEVEIVISDNASTDATPAVAEIFRARYPDKIAVHRQAQAVPGSHNFALVLEAGRGELRKLHNDTLLVKPGFWETGLKLIRDWREKRPVLFFLNGRGSSRAPLTLCPNLDAFIGHVSFFCTWIGAFSLWAEDVPAAARLFREAPHQLAQTEILFELAGAGRLIAVHNPEFGAPPPDVPKFLSTEQLRPIYYEAYAGLLERAVREGCLAESVKRRELRRFFFLFYAPQLCRMKKLAGSGAWSGRKELAFIKDRLPRLDYYALYPCYALLCLAFGFLRRSRNLQEIARRFL